MPLSAPTNVAIFNYPTFNQIGWTESNSYTPADIASGSPRVVIYRKIGDGAYASYDTIFYPTDSYDDYDWNYPNDRVYYKLKAFCSPYVDSEDSAEVSIGRFSDTAGATVTETPALSSETMAMADTMPATVTATPALSSQTMTMADTMAATVTATPLWGDAVSVRTDYKYFWADETGYLYTYDAEYLSDNTVPIMSYWTSKETDFADTLPQYKGRWKTVYRARLVYVDKGSHTVTVYISTDGGATWTSQTRTIGTNTGEVKDALFYFIKQGKYFRFKILNLSTDEDFQWIGLWAEFTPGGIMYEVT